MFWEGKGAVQYYAKVSNTGMKSKGGKSFYGQGEVKLRKLLGSAEPDKLRLVLIQRNPSGRHPEVQISRESINAASKSEMIRRWTMDERLHIPQLKQGHPPETMMHFPLFQISPLFSKKCSNSYEHFQNFTFSRKISWIFHPPKFLMT